MKRADISDGLTVKYRGKAVGTLARSREGRTIFQYDPEWLSTGFSINPYSLPLSSEVFVPEWEPFNGLFGAFHDSLPDGWGSLLLDRKLRAEGINPAEVGSLDRLAIVGSSGRGALTYEPQVDFKTQAPLTDLDELAIWCSDILADRDVADFDAVFAVGGSSAGARPKAYINRGDGTWLVKFPSSLDPEGIGRLEYDYMGAASACGIEVPEYRLFPSGICEGFFGTKRFDVDEAGERIHMLTASGIVEVSHRVPALDYEGLFQVSSFLGGGRSEAKRIFRLMCFNVFAHNQDDHSNNFSWLCAHGEWRLSPAYDLTYSSGFGHQHSTSVLGAGNPSLADVLDLARSVGLPRVWARQTADEIQAICHDLLASHGLKE